VKEFSLPSSVSHVEPIFARTLEAAGFRLVRLRMTGNARKTLQVMAERPDGTMSVEDCTGLSEILSDFLEAQDPIGGDYLLEVSSPGIDRPLTRPADFSRWAGFDAKIELVAPLEGRKRFVAVPQGLAGNEIVLEVGGKTLQIPFAAVAEAKLILTDKLIEATARVGRPDESDSSIRKLKGASSHATGD
jgi:ribosome maturation factor RimP